MVSKIFYVQPYLGKIPIKQPQLPLTPPQEGCMHPGELVDWSTNPFWRSYFSSWGWLKQPPTRILRSCDCLPVLLKPFGFMMCPNFYNEAPACGCTKPGKLTYPKHPGMSWERDCAYIPILFGWDWNPNSYSREGSGFLGIGCSWKTGYRYINSHFWLIFYCYFSRWGLSIPKHKVGKWACVTLAELYILVPKKIVPWTSFSRHLLKKRVTTNSLRQSTGRTSWTYIQDPHWKQIHFLRW